jgi:predicted Zn-ribbon and HTH transcriptional regulator
VLYVICLPLAIACGIARRVGWRGELERVMIEHNMRPAVCFQCGYDLRGTTSPGCPECGRRIAPLTDETPQAEPAACARMDSVTKEGGSMDEGNPTPGEGGTAPTKHDEPLELRVLVVIAHWVGMGLTYVAIAILLLSSDETRGASPWMSIALLCGGLGFFLLFVCGLAAIVGRAGSLLRRRGRDVDGVELPNDFAGELVDQEASRRLSKHLGLAAPPVLSAGMILIGFVICPMMLRGLAVLCGAMLVASGLFSFLAWYHRWHAERSVVLQVVALEYRLRPELCRRCGWDLRKSISATCPKCGREVELLGSEEPC